MDIITDITQKNTRYGCHVGMTLDFKAPKVGICNFDVNDRNGTSSNCGFDAAIASSFGQKSTERLSTEMEETYRIYRYLESTAFRKKNLVILEISHLGQILQTMATNLRTNAMIFSNLACGVVGGQTAPPPTKPMPQTDRGFGKGN